MEATTYPAKMNNGGVASIEIRKSPLNGERYLVTYIDGIQHQTVQCPVVNPHYGKAPHIQYAYAGLGVGMDEETYRAIMTALNR